MHHHSKFNPDVSLIECSSIWREIRLAMVLPVVKYQSLHPICLAVSKWPKNQAQNGKGKKKHEPCPIQLHEHYIDDNVFDFGTRYTHHELQFTETFSVFRYMLAFLDWMLFHFRNVALNDIGCDHQVLNTRESEINTHKHT